MRLAYSTMIRKERSTSSTQRLCRKLVGISLFVLNLAYFDVAGSFFSRGLWAQVPKIAYSEPSIKHSMIALSNFHEQFTTRLVPASSALRYYMMAIKELRSGIPTITGILCLMMFFAIEVNIEIGPGYRKLISRSSYKRVTVLQCSFYV